MEERTRTEQNGLITEELRDWMGASTHNTIGTELIMGSYNKLLDIADRIDERIEREYIEAPVDADGVPWHRGDKVDGMVGEITYLSLGCIGWQFRLGDAYTFQCEKYRHYHEPTVEDVLREFAEKIIDSQIPNVHPTYEEAIAEYAAKLRLAGEAE